jgi:hypothetical protein
MVFVQRRSLASVLGKTSQYSKQKHIPSRHAQYDKDYKTAIKALHNYQINSKLAWDCHEFLVKCAEHKRIQLI